MRPGVRWFHYYTFLFFYLCRGLVDLKNMNWISWTSGTFWQGCFCATFSNDSKSICYFVVMDDIHIMWDNINLSTGRHFATPCTMAAICGCVRVIVVNERFVMAILEFSITSVSWFISYLNYWELGHIESVYFIHK